MKRSVCMGVACALSFNHAILYAQEPQEPIQIEIEIDSAPVEVQLPTTPPEQTEPAPAVVKETPPAPKEEPKVAETPADKQAPPAEDKEKKSKPPGGIGIAALVAGLLAAAGGGGGGGGGSATSHQ